MNIVLFDHPEIKRALLPLTFTRPIADLRLGILTIVEKWSHDMKTSASFLAEEYLQKKYPNTAEEDNLYINGALCPDEALVPVLKELTSGQGLTYQNVLIAARTGAVTDPTTLLKQSLNTKEYMGPLILIDQTWHLFLQNGRQIELDYLRVTKNRISEKITDPHTVVYASENVFIEAGVSIKAGIINAEGGPVYLGKNTEVQEGTIIQGPFALCEGSQLRLGGKMRPNTTIGPWCKVGGEVGNVIFHSYSNKAHEGFLGNSVIGAWCNMGADTNNSNLKNNYSSVQVWDYQKEAPVNTGLQFCGTIMGDHSKCGINTMLNTGTVVGVSANIFGGGFPPKFVPSYAWGAVEQLSEYQFEKSCETIAVVMQRKSLEFDNVERDIMWQIFQDSQSNREKSNF